jgi:WD40 repeat protein
MRAAAKRPGSLREVSLALDLGWRVRQDGVVGSGVVEAGGFAPDRVGDGPPNVLADLFEVLAKRVAAALPDDAHRKVGAELLRSLIDAESGALAPLDLETARPTGSDARARFDRVLTDLQASSVVDQRRVDGTSWVMLRVPEFRKHWPGFRPAAVAAASAPRAASRRPRSRGLAWVAALLLFSAAGAGLLGWWGQQSHQRHQARERFEEARRVSHDPTTAAVLLRQIPAMLRPEGWASAANLALQSPQAERVLRFDGGNVQQLTFSPDSSHILIRVDGSLRLMRPQSTNAPTELRPPAGDGGFVAARFSPSGASVVTVTRSGRVMSWPVQGGASTDIASAVDGDAGVVAAFSPKGTHVVRTWAGRVQVQAIDGSDVQTARVPNARTGVDDAPCCAVVSGDGERWAIGTEGGRILLYKAGRRTPTVLRLPGLRQFHLNRGGTHLLALGDGTMRIIDLVRGTGSSRTPASVRVDAAVFSPDGRHIAVDYLERETDIHKVRSVAVSSRRSQRESPELDGRATALAAGEGGNLLLRATDGAVAELDVETGVATTEYRGHRGPVREVRQSPDGMWLATSGVDGTVRLWRRAAESPALVAHPPRTLMGADPLVFGPGGEVVGGVSVGGRFVAASLDAAAEPVDLGQAPGPMQMLRVSAAGDRIVAVDAEEMLHVRSVREDASWSRSLPGSVITVSPLLDVLLVRDGARGVARLSLSRADARPEPLPVPSASVTRAAFTTDGRWLALGYEDGKVHLLDTATGEERGVVNTSAGRITALCVSNDGQQAAIGSTTGALRLWRPQTGEETALVSDGPVPRNCAFAEDDGTLVIQTGTEAEVWTLSGPAPRRLMVAPTRRPAGGATAWIDTQEDALVTLDAQGRANSWLLDPEELHARLWKSTPTCELGGEAPVDLKRWCACESCFGRSPDACAEMADDPLTADLDRIVSWCPMAPAEHG